jgi:hypothetical protein
LSDWWKPFSSLDSSLAAICRFFWRSGSRVSIHYGVRWRLCFEHHPSLD